MASTAGGWQELVWEGSSLLVAAGGPGLGTSPPLLQLLCISLMAENCHGLPCRVTIVPVGRPQEVSRSPQGVSGFCPGEDDVVETADWYLPVGKSLKYCRSRVVW